MGMFDDVKFKMLCPVCKEMIDDFQTKSMGKTMSEYSVSELPDKANFYSSCHKCGLWAEFIKHHLPNEEEAKERIKKLFHDLKKKEVKK